MNKVRKYRFDYKILRYGGLDKVRLAQMVKQLPDDFYIVGWGNEYDRMASYFIIHSEEFDEVSDCQAAPEHLLNFTR